MGKSDIPSLTRDQMAEVDRIMVEELGIDLIQMMENAGRDLAELARRWLGGQVAGRRIAALCGAGNNGGGGMVAARHLHNWGAEVQAVLAAEPAHLKEVPAHQWRILERLSLIGPTDLDLTQYDLILDALIGYGLQGNPNGMTADLILKANQSAQPVIALDVPSGLDATLGLPGEPCMRATATLTLALPKTGLQSPAAKPFTGELYLADISVPPEAYRKLGLEVHTPFVTDTIIKVN
ncbi:MAG TPA: NAD(P)H-hydrate epimerase [Anaerolineales bacterium]